MGILGIGIVGPAGRLDNAWCVGENLKSALLRSIPMAPRLGLRRSPPVLSFVLWDANRQHGRRQHPGVKQHEKTNVQRTKRNPQGSPPMGQYTRMHLCTMKFQLAHFTKSIERINADTPVQVELGEIRPEACAHMLN
jgi:hypothetical protein